MGRRRIRFPVHGRNDLHQHRPNDAFAAFRARPVMRPGALNSQREVCAFGDREYVVFLLAQLQHRLRALPNDPEPIVPAPFQLPPRDDCPDQPHAYCRRPGAPRSEPPRGQLCQMQHLDRSPLALDARNAASIANGPSARNTAWPTASHTIPTERDAPFGSVIQMRPLTVVAQGIAVLARVGDMQAPATVPAAEGPPATLALADGTDQPLRQFAFRRSAAGSSRSRPS